MKMPQCQYSVRVWKERWGRTRVNGTLLHILPVPLTNARTAGVGQNQATNILKGAHLSITLNGSTDLLGTRGDSELRLGVQTVSFGLTGDGSSAGHVLVRRVGARTDESDLELSWPVVLDYLILELGERGGEIGSEGTVDVRLEFRKVLSSVVRSSAHKSHA